MDDVLQRFIEQAPVAVMVRATLTHVLADSTLDDLFRRTAQVQYTRDLTFSTLVKLLAKVTFGTHPSVHAAYRHTQGLPVSITAVYDKLQGVETAVAQALVGQTARALHELLNAWPGSAVPPLPGLRLRTVDGNFLAGTDHRLDCLRGSGAAALPGMSLVVRDGQTGLLTDLIPCEDAYTNERSLHAAVVALAQANDLWLADRNFCTLDFLAGWQERGAFFVVRHHAGTTLEPLGPERAAGCNATGDLSEQPVRLGGLVCRCIVVRLHRPLRDGARQLRLVSNVPPGQGTAGALAELYRQRWQIETAFQELTENLRCEIKTLGYPKAALFGFALAVVAYNVLVVIQAALRAGQRQAGANEELSSYHLASEVAVQAEGMAVALPSCCWQRFAGLSREEFAAWLQEVARGVDWKRYRKSKRGPKKSRTIKKTQRGAHRSTARLLNEQHLSP